MRVKLSIKLKKASSDKPIAATTKLAPKKIYKDTGNSFSSKLPTSKDAEQYLGHKIQSESKERIALDNFEKTNGLKQSHFGVEY